MTCICIEKMTQLEKTQVLESSKYYYGAILSMLLLKLGRCLFTVFYNMSKKCLFE